MKDTDAYFPLPFEVKHNLISNFTIYSECFEDDPDMHEYFDIEEYTNPMEMWADADELIHLLKNAGSRVIFRPEFILSESDYES